MPSVAFSGDRYTRNATEGVPYRGLKVKCDETRKYPIVRQTLATDYNA